MEAELVELEHYMQGSSGSPEGEQYPKRWIAGKSAKPGWAELDRQISPPLPRPSVSPMRASSRKKRRMHLFMRTLSA